MNLDLVILAIRQRAPIFGGNVAGAVQYFNAKDNGFLKLPAAYVLPLSDEVSTDRDLSGYFQRFSERMSVIVVLDNALAFDAGDRRGQNAMALFDALKWGLFKALVHWNPNSTRDNPGIVTEATPGANRQEGHGLYYVGGDPLEPDGARSFFQFTFGLDVVIGDEDVWQPGSVPLQSIGLDIDRPAVFGGAFDDEFGHFLAHLEVNLTAP